ncbi:MAG: YbaB/EbfC family nucleoid-associated protein [Myxococcales bacterium]|nr:YbaB/EbfC family nucleoid-associated protein [Myxococcales bacterium]
MNPPDMKKMLEQAQAMQNKMSKLQAELAKMRFEASAGGGMVKAVASGDLKIVEIRIEDSIFASGDRALVQDLAAAAVNAALANAQRHAQEQVQRFSFNGLSMLNPDGDGP